ncbi:MAG: hypothetical protein ACI4JM_07150 [Oscillospiraceae bacterium]
MFEEEFQQIIDIISKEYISNNLKYDINLKKKTIKKANDDGVLEELVLSYLEFLNENTIEFQLRFSSFTTSNILKSTSRVKNNNSVYYKINRYITEKSESGGIPINKCLNDLFGLRIIIANNYTLDDLLFRIKNMYPDSKCINASKNDYKAIHIYFTTNNFTFPWELQIWLQKDEKTNYLSHKKYKQEYTKWESEYKENLLI